jgi:integrase
MARKVRDKDLGDRASRGKLKPSGKPYWRILDQGLHLGYRKNKNSGKWVVRLYQKGAKKPYVTDTLPGVADDKADPDNDAVVSFFQAQVKAREWFAEQQKKVAGPAAHYTVGQALHQYEADLRMRGGDTRNVARVRHHLSDALSQKSVELIEAKELRHWRDELAKKLAAGTVNRTAVGLMAALNLAADLDKRIAVNRDAWRVGLRAIANADASRNVILPEPVIRTIINKASDEGDEFALYVEVLAVTGARCDQAARLRVENLQDRRAEPRLLMPVSRKGRGRKEITHRPVPITPGLAAKLRAAVNGRAPTEPLLVKRNGQPWKKSDHARPFARVAIQAGLEEVTIYALRHSNIVRQLLAGVPVRVVAVNHDTSIRMIERTYSRYIGDHADALTRAALLDTSTTPRLGIVEAR